MKVLASSTNNINNTKFLYSKKNSDGNVNFRGYNFPVKKIKGLHCAYCSRRLITPEEITSISSFFEQCNSSPKSLNALAKKLIDLSSELSPKAYNRVQYIVSRIRGSHNVSPMYILEDLAQKNKNPLTIKYLRAIYASLLNNRIETDDNIFSKIFNMFHGAFKHADGADIKLFDNILTNKRFTSSYNNYINNQSDIRVIKKELKFAESITKTNSVFSVPLFLKSLDTNSKACEKLRDTIYIDFEKFNRLETDIRKRFKYLDSDPRSYFALNSEFSSEKLIGGLFSDLVPTTDHIDPKSNGGIDKLQNYLLTCASCNSKRRNAPLSEYVYENNLQGNIQASIEEIDSAIPLLPTKDENTILEYIIKIKERLNQIFGASISPKTPNTDNIVKTK